MCSKETFRDQFTNGTVEIYKKVTIYFYNKYTVAFSIHFLYLRLNRCGQTVVV